MSSSLSLEFSPVFLKNPISCGLFSYFLESEFNCENLLFWHAVENFKQITDVAKVPGAANEIFNKYIANGSPDAVNLGFTVVQSLQVKLRDLLLKIETRLSSPGDSVSRRDLLQKAGTGFTIRLNQRDKQKEKEKGHGNRSWGWGTEHNPSVEDQVDQYMNASFEFEDENTVAVKTVERTEPQVADIKSSNSEDDKPKTSDSSESDAEDELLALYTQLHGIFDEAQEHIHRSQTYYF